jgi:uncharacterized Zn finger protein
MAAKVTKAEVYGESWWAERLRLHCEQKTSGTRATSARTYVRQGRVLAWELGPGRITAEVQGKEVWPYEVTIEFDTFEPDVVDAMARWLQTERAIALGILGGELAEAVELQLNELNTSLFPKPGKPGRIPSQPICDCSCFDFSYACRHAMAVIYTLCRELDARPLLLLQWRGLPVDEWLAASVTQTLLPGPETPPGYYRGGDGWLDPLPLRATVDPLAMLRKLGPAPITAGRTTVDVPLAEAFGILATEATHWLTRLA